MKALLFALQKLLLHSTKITEAFFMIRKIIITKEDSSKIKKTIDDAFFTEGINKEDLKDLEMELNRAQVVDIGELPVDVITMDSRVILSLDGEEEEFCLVYPHDADVSKNKISILSPIGTAILGYREGDTIEWRVPSGVVEVKVVKVLYQPEAEQRITK